jgi:3D (Asp-Asp-Asp) domain-containing protein
MPTRRPAARPLRSARARLVPITIEDALPSPKSEMVANNTSPIPYIATAYCARGTTALGTATRPGVIAVDPHRIRLGSIVTILGGIGQRIRSRILRAEDVGGGIRGNRIDVWMPTCAQALAFGRRPVLVRVQALR